MEYKHGELTSKIIGAAMSVHSILGNGFQEVIYQRSLEIMFREQQLIFARELSLPVFFKGLQVGERRVDFLVEEKICVELKAIVRLEPVHLAQAMNYLEAFDLEIGLLINFGTNSLEWRRLTNKKYMSRSE
jgi:GxxExxY protein